MTIYTGSELAIVTPFLKMESVDYNTFGGTNKF